MDTEVLTSRWHYLQHFDSYLQNNYFIHFIFITIHISNLNFILELGTCEKSFFLFVSLPLLLTPILLFRVERNDNVNAAVVWAPKCSLPVLRWPTGEQHCYRLRSGAWDGLRFVHFTYSMDTKSDGVAQLTARERLTGESQKKTWADAPSGQIWKCSSTQTHILLVRISVNI